MQIFDFVKGSQRFLPILYKILLRDYDITTNIDGVTNETTSNFFKNLMFKFETGVHYQGVGAETTVHDPASLVGTTPDVILVV